MRKKQLTWFSFLNFDKSEIVEKNIGLKKDFGVDSLRCAITQDFPFIIKTNCCLKVVVNYNDCARIANLGRE